MPKMVSCPKCGELAFESPGEIQCNSCGKVRLPPQIRSAPQQQTYNPSVNQKRPPENWWLQQTSGTRSGPHTYEQIERAVIGGNLTREEWVCAEGWSQWKTIGEVFPRPELPRNPSSPPIAVTSLPSVASRWELPIVESRPGPPTHRSGWSKRTGSNTRLALGIAGGVALGVIGLLATVAVTQRNRQQVDLSNRRPKSPFVSNSTHPVVSRELSQDPPKAANDARSTTPFTDSPERHGANSKHINTLAIIETVDERNHIFTTPYIHLKKDLVLAFAFGYPNDGSATPEEKGRLFGGIYILDTRGKRVITARTNLALTFSGLKFVYDRPRLSRSNNLISGGQMDVLEYGELEPAGIMLFLEHIKSLRVEVGEVYSDVAYDLPEEDLAILRGLHKKIHTFEKQHGYRVDASNPM
jgi:hypothetical protein